MEEERIDDELLDLDDVLAPEEASSDTGQLYEHFRVEVDKGQEPERIDKYLSVRMQHSSCNRIQKAADAGSIHVNGTPVKSNYKVRPEDVITLMLHQPKHDTSIVAEDIPLDIVYEDDQLMVINKPAGMVVHPGAGNFHGTLINAVAWHMRNVPSFDANNPEVGLVHRIDKDTSGLLVVAKTPEAKTLLGKQFFHKTTHRSYIALVWANFVEEEGRIEGNIARDVRDRLRMAVFPPDSETGKPAVTHWRVLERFGYTTLVECILETGHTRSAHTCAISAIRSSATHAMAARRSCADSVAAPTRRSYRTAFASARDKPSTHAHWASSTPRRDSRWISRRPCQPTWSNCSQNGGATSMARRRTPSSSNKYELQDKV